MTSAEVYREHRKILIRLRDWHLARYEAARDKRKVQADFKRAEALTSAISLLEHEIEIRTVMQSHLINRLDHKKAIPV